MKWWIVLKNDFRVLLRDVGLLATLFLMPLGFILPVSFALGSGDGYGVAADNRQILLPVLNRDGGEQAQRLLEDLQQSLDLEQNYTLKQVQALGLTEDPACAQLGMACDERVVEYLLEQHGRRLALIIPAGFSEAVVAGQKTELILVYDPAGDAERRQQVQGVLNGAAVRISLQYSTQQALDEMMVVSAFAPGGLNEFSIAEDTEDSAAIRIETVQPERFSLTEIPDTYQQTVPGYTVMFVFFIIGYLSSVIRDEKRSGTLRRLLCAPVRVRSLLLGKMASALCIGVVQVAVMFAAGALIFGLGLGRDLFALLLVTVALVASATGLGLAVATTRLGSVLSPILILSALLGGCMFPLDLMPPFLRTISYITPHRWALDGYQDLMVRGQGLVDVLPNLAVLLGIAAIGFGVALLRFDADE